MSIFKAGYKAVRTAMSRSEKLQFLYKKRRFGEDFNSWGNLADIRLTARAALSCLTEFRGDFGEAARCSCGEIDTFAHVRRTCPTFFSTRKEYISRDFTNTQLLGFTKEVLRKRREESNKNV